MQHLDKQCKDPIQYSKSEPQSKENNQKPFQNSEADFEQKTGEAEYYEDNDDCQEVGLNECKNEIEHMYIVAWYSHIDNYALGV